MDIFNCYIIIPNIAFDQDVFLLDPLVSILGKVHNQIQLLDNSPQIEVSAVHNTAFWSKQS